MPDSHKIAELFLSREWAWVASKVEARYMDSLYTVQGMAFDTQKVCRALGKADAFQEVASKEFAKSLIEQARKEENEQEED